MREVEIDVCGRVRAVRPELDREPADDDRSLFDPLYELVDQGNYGELSLRRMLERESALELGPRLVHAFDATQQLRRRRHKLRSSRPRVRRPCQRGD